MIAFKKEIDNYKSIIAGQFSQIVELDKQVKHLQTLNDVKYESFKQQVTNEVNEKLKQNKNILDENRIIYEETHNERIEIEKFRSKIYHFKNIHNEIKERENKKYDYINVIMKTHNYECCVCYEQLTIENIHLPYCHITHGVCKNCASFLNKCPMCKKKFEDLIINNGSVTEETIKLYKSLIRNLYLNDKLTNIWQEITGSNHNVQGDITKMFHYASDFTSRSSYLDNTRTWFITMSQIIINHLNIIDLKLYLKKEYNIPFEV